MKDAGLSAPALRQSLLQDHIVPICVGDTSKGEVRLRRLLGTAFFVGNGGVFLTAKHVFEVTAQRSAKSSLGLVVESEDVGAKNLFAPLLAWEGAPLPNDVAVGRIGFSSTSWFSLAHGSLISHWLDVATLGYPESALDASPERFDIHLRALKGYVPRPVKAGAMGVLAPHPDCLELSFPVTSGMSGAPLFVARGGRQELVGLCVGSYCAEVEAYRSTEVGDDGRVFEERQLRVEQYGIAESLFSLLDWMPGILGNRSLGEFIGR